MTKSKNSEFSRMLKLREKQKKKLPDFIRSDSWKVKKISRTGWRKPKGLDNKMRKQKKGYPPLVKIGYRKIKKVRNLHPSGLEEVLVHNSKDLIGLDKNKHIIRIASKVGRKKRLEILEAAERLGLKVINSNI